MVLTQLMHLVIERQVIYRKSDKVLNKEMKSEKDMQKCTSHISQVTESIRDEVKQVDEPCMPR